MAFKTAAGHSSLPNGNFSPVIYSQKVQQAFRKTSVVESITTLTTSARLRTTVTRLK